MELPDPIKNPNLTLDDFALQAQRSADGLSRIVKVFGGDPALVIRDVEITIGFCYHVAKQTGARNMGEVLCALRERKIHPKIVELFVDESRIFQPYLSGSIAAGYPEYTIKLD